jgi:hypothetical protein
MVFATRWQAERSSAMKCMGVFLIGLILVGCEYTVPLVVKPEIEIDKAVLGVWEQRTEDNKPERLLVLPLDDKEYLVSFPSETDKAMFARACLVRIAGETLVQLRWFGTVQGDLARDNRVYQYAVFSVVKDTLSVRMLNADVVPKTVKSPDELAGAIAEGMDQPDLFREPMVFQRVEKRK